MNRRHQILNDLHRLLCDGRINFSNVGYITKTDAPHVYFDVYFCDELILPRVVLDQDYSNILGVAALVFKAAHPTRKDAPLMRLRVNTLGAKRTVTLGVTYASNLEFFDMRNDKASDKLADALLGSIDSDLLVYVGNAYYGALVSSSRYHVTHTLKLNLDE